MQTKHVFVMLVIWIIAGVFLFRTFTRAVYAPIIITEVYAAGSSGHEWLEVHNQSDAIVDLGGWKFVENDTNHSLTLVQGDDSILHPGEHAIITQNDTNFIADYPNVTSTIFDSSWGSLNEGGEEIALRDAEGNIVEQFTYTSSTDFSLEKIDISIDDYTQSNWKEHPDGSTPGAKNHWSVQKDIAENIPPTAAITATSTALVGTTIVFEASGSSDTDGDITAYSWDFGDEDLSEGLMVSHTYTTTGTFNVFLEVEDNLGATSTATHTIFISEEVITEKPAHAAKEGSVIINEIMANPIVGTEWIELHNTTTSTIDLTGWILEDGVGTIAAPTSTIGPSELFVIELSSNKLNNGGDMMRLLSPEEIIIDSITYGTWDDGSATDNVPAPEKGDTLARDDSGKMVETLIPTKGEKNDIVPPQDPEPEEPEGTQNENDGGGSIDLGTHEVGDIVINELVSDPADNEVEFVELYNTTPDDINLADWYLKEGSESKTTLAGTIESHSFFVIEKPKGNLNNGGDIVTLFDPSDKKIAAVTYGNWDDGNTSDNAPAADDPLSISRHTDGEDTGTDADDFRLTTTITKGEENIITKNDQAREEEEESENSIPNNTSPGSSDIIISEIYPNPVGPDSEGEFIELHNIGDGAINLDGWKLGDATTNRHTVQDIVIDSGEYITFKREVTDIALNNSGGDTVTLFAPNDDTVNEVTYEGKAEEGESYALIEGEFVWTPTLTPGKQNAYEIEEILPDTSTSTPENIDTTTTPSISTPPIVISEFLPNPEGSDGAEWVELYNPTEKPLDLSGHKLDDEDGGSKPYTFPEDTVIEPGQYLVFHRKETKLALNNTTDAVRILTPDKTVLTEVTYTDVTEGASYVQTEEDIWAWSTEPTPGEKNIIKKITAQTKKKSTKKQKPIIKTTLEKIRNEDVGDLIQTTGVVSVKPGLLGSQYFYIFDARGVQVYMHKKDFPALTPGDMVQITGELSEASGETRVKIKNKADIQKLEHSGELTPTKTEIDNIGESLEGSFVEAEGEITEIKGSHMFIDDGSAEVKVYIKKGTNINKKVFQVGDIVSVTGIVSQTKTGYQLLPRMQSDIQKTGIIEDRIQATQNNEEDESKEIAEKYLTATAGGLTSILVGLAAKGRSNVLGDLLKRIGVLVGSIFRKKK